MEVSALRYYEEKEGQLCRKQCKASAEACAVVWDDFGTVPMLGIFRLPFLQTHGPKLLQIAPEG